jgi:hypothetical protein
MHSVLDDGSTRIDQLSLNWHSFLMFLFAVSVTVDGHCQILNIYANHWTFMMQQTETGGRSMFTMSRTNTINMLQFYLFQTFR